MPRLWVNRPWGLMVIPRFWHKKNCQAFGNWPIDLFLDYAAPKSGEYVMLVCNQVVKSCEI